ncbi:hypothetical protein Tco_1163917 [Tanacetum coccineum]
MDQEVNNHVERDEYAISEFVNSLILSQEDLDARIDPGSHKVRPKEKKNDDNDNDNDDYNDYSLIRKRKQAHDVELTDSEAPITDVPSSSRPYLIHSKHIKGVVAKLSRRHNHMLPTLMKNFMHRSERMKLCTAISNMMENIPIPSLQERLYNQRKESQDAQTADSEIWDSLKVHVTCREREWKNTQKYEA